MFDGGDDFGKRHRAMANWQDLRLRDKNRELVNKGPLKRRGGNRDEIADLMGFLFDHAFLLVKPKYVNKAEQLRVYRRVSTAYPKLGDDTDDQAHPVRATSRHVTRRDV